MTSCPLPRIVAAIVLAVACAGADSAPARESRAAQEISSVSRDQAVQLARMFVARETLALRAIHLDSVDVAEGEATWHVMFRRRAMVLPNVLTVDVDRRTGAMRFPGDE